MELRSHLALLALSVIACAASPSNTFGQVASPPPPIPIFDPKPGPWIIDFKPDSAEYLNEDQAAVIHTAMQSWGRVEGYSFLLCYDGENRGTLPISRLRAVAGALYRAGAGSVVYGDTLCDRLNFAWAPSGGVIILGVFTFRP